MAFASRKTKLENTIASREQICIQSLVSTFKCISKKLEYAYVLRFLKLYDISYEKFIHFWGKTLMSKNTMIDHEKYIFSEFVLDLVFFSLFCPLFSSQQLTSYNYKHVRNSVPKGVMEQFIQYEIRRYQMLLVPLLSFTQILHANTAICKI